jgi:hypothetical protein
MSNRTNIDAASKNILFVPLNRLMKSPKNWSRARPFVQYRHKIAGRCRRVCAEFHDEKMRDVSASTASAFCNLPIAIRGAISRSFPLRRLQHYRPPCFLGHHHMRISVRRFRVLPGPSCD